MEDKSVKRNQQQAVPVVLVPQAMESDETGLIDLWQVLWRRKLVLIATMAVVLVISVAYALLATPVYKAEAHLLPPSSSDLQQLQIMPNTHGIKAKDVFSLFLRNLNSLSMRRKYFNENHLGGQFAANGNVEGVFEGFSKAFAVSKDAKNSGGEVVSYEGPDASLAAKWVNGLVDMANARTVRQLVRTMTGKLGDQKQVILDGIAAKRKLARQRKEDRLAALKEALVIAKKVGIKNPKSLGQPMGENTPLYLLGYRALEAEVVALQQRKNDDSFIAGLRQMQERLAMLENIQFDPSRISAVTIDQAAFVPDHGIKPKRKLIVILGLIGGLTAGVLLAFFVDFVARERGRRKAEMI